MFYILISFLHICGLLYIGSTQLSASQGSSISPTGSQVSIGTLSHESTEPILSKDEMLLEIKQLWMLHVCMWQVS